MDKTAIAVYTPDDPLEQAIQNACHHYTGMWLPAYHCQLVAESLSVLKRFDDWLDNKDLLPTRMAYIFAPHMSEYQDQMVFLTHGLFLRDILENKAINSYLHDPITLVCHPLAHYLFRDFPVHMHMDVNMLKAENPNVNFVSVGGLIITEGNNITVSSQSISHIVADESSQDTVDKIQMECGTMKKAASIEKEPGVFYLGEHDREWGADVAVIHKQMRSHGMVTVVEPGETGLIIVEMDDGEVRSVPKMEFDIHYSLV